MTRYRNDNSHVIYVRESDDPTVPRHRIASGGEVDATGEFADNLEATNNVSRVGGSPRKANGKPAAKPKSNSAKRRQQQRRSAKKRRDAKAKSEASAERSGVTGSGSGDGAISTSSTPATKE